MAIRNAASLPTSVEGSGPVISKQVPPDFKGSVMARVLKQSFGPSNSTGKPQISLNLEIILPEKHKHEGKTYDLTSLTPRIFLPFSDTDKNGNQTDHHKYYIEVLFPKLGLPIEYDDENPLNVLKFEGLVLEVYMTSKEKIEQRKLPDGSYEQVLDFKNQLIKRGYEFNMIDKKDILGLGDIAATVAASNKPA